MAGRLVRDRWVTLTPDNDVAEEDLDQLDNPTMVVELGDDGSRPFLHEEIYAFKAPVDNADMLKWLRKGREVSLADAKANGGSVPFDFTEWMDWDGERQPLPADLKSKRGLPGPKGATAPSGVSLDRPSESWNIITPCAGHKVGDRLPLVNVQWIAGDHATVRLGPGPGVGGVVLLEKPLAVTPEVFIEDQKKLATAFYGLEAAPEPDDMRTLGIELNARGRRHKAFPVAVSQLVEDAFDDWPLKDNLRTFLWLVEKMDGDGLAPVAWVESYLARKKFSGGGRAAHELRSMGKTIESVLCYDQLNAASLVSMEHVARRFQLIIGAHAENAQQPSYVGSHLYLEEGEEAVAPDLKKKVTTGLKDEAKTASNLESLRALKTKPPRKADPKAKV